jgi:hypothetical protein
VTTPYRVPVLEHFAWQSPVITRGLSSPPISPAPVKNDRYIVKATGSGDWTGCTNQITYYDGSAWKFTAPTEGFICWVNDEDYYYSYNGSAWIKYSSDQDARRYALLVGGGM